MRYIAIIALILASSLTAAIGADEKYWKDALVPIKDQPGLPRVLLIGDSVSVCYTLATRDALKGEANVHRIPENGGHTGKALERIDAWLGDGKWDVIHFNWGLHDLRQGIGTSVDQYEKNLRKLVKRMQATGAKLIWCTNTPLPADVGRSAAGTETVLAYNAVAKKVMDENGVAIDDLYTFAKPQLAKLQVPRSANFTEEGSKVLATQVAGSIRKALPGSTPKGQRIFVCGHSFHVGIVEPLQDVARLAGITDQKLVGSQFLGGSQVLKHWDLPDDRDKARKAIRTGGVDVLTLSPKAQLPDEGIDKFTALALEYNPTARVTVQESWASFDSPTKANKNFKNEDRDKADVDALRKTHAPIFKALADQVRGLNDNLMAAQKRQVVYLVPAGRAVLTLREKVAAGQVPGIAKQSDLFADATGHGKGIRDGKGVVNLLTTYCTFAVIYGRSPLGLPVPSALKGQVSAEHEEKLNRLLQEIAWEAVSTEPLTGVKK
jgi:hypothetical protein